MEVHTGNIDIATSADHSYVDVTDELNRFIARTKVRTGIANIFCPHTTAAVVVQEGDKAMHEDTIEALKRLLPLNQHYRHSLEGPLNATAHIKNQLLGAEVTLPVREGKLHLGTWQRVLFFELCRADSRKLELTLIGD